MINLQKFLELIELARQPLKGHYAYRMDHKRSHPDMRIEIGLGTCNCCDYFTTYNNDSILLIEETSLVDQRKNLEKKYDYIKSPYQKKFIDEKIKEENKLKAYGAVLVLYRLSAVCEDAKELLEAKSYKFWIVVTGNYSPQDAMYFNNLESYLFQEIKGGLRTIFEDVAVIPANDFVKKLPQNATNP